MFLIDDITTCLRSRIAECSEDELDQMIHYCRQLPLTDAIAELYLDIIRYGFDDIREADRVRKSILAAMATDPTSGGWVVNHRNEKELATVREWKDDPDLPLSIRRFAEEAEQDKKRMEKLFEL